MKLPNIDQDYLEQQLKKILAIPSPVGLTDEIVHYTGAELEKLGVEIELTRRGAIRGTMPGTVESPDRAIVVHLDTLGAMVKNVKKNGRCEVVPIGTWSARFAEGARVTLLTDSGNHRGTILPLKASGHTFDDEVDTQPVAWNNVELRLDEMVSSKEDLDELGVNIGDFVLIDPLPEFVPNGYINSRHLDDKAGVAALLAAIKAVKDAGIDLPVTCHPLFTISEEVGSGASTVLHQDVAEMVTIDNATPAPGQNSKETGVTIAMMDSVGPFDYHLTHRLLELAKEFDIGHQRDVFKYYRSDSAAAIDAGNDIRTALVCFGVDSSHGYERTHIDSLVSLAKLLVLYMQSEPLFIRDKEELSDLKSFPDVPYPEHDMA